MPQTHGGLVRGLGYNLLQKQYSQFIVQMVSIVSSFSAISNLVFDKIKNKTKRKQMKYCLDGLGGKEVNQSELKVGKIHS